MGLMVPRKSNIEALVAEAEPEEVEKADDEKEHEPDNDATNAPADDDESLLQPDHEKSEI